jgi:hypothetical protein
MDFKKEWKTLIWLAAAFLVAYHLPVGTIRFDGAVMEGLHLVKSYAREHVILCLLPAFFIAGAISVFVSQGAVMRYLGSQAHPAVAYGVASISGTILAVCSCTVLPLFGGIYKRGAGLGPAVAFLYSGPAINVLAIVLTARVLGLEMGAARTVGAVAFSVAAGLIMQFLFRKEEAQRAEASAQTLPEIPARALWKTTVVFAAMVGILVLANWGAASGGRRFPERARRYFRKRLGRRLGPLGLFLAKQKLHDQPRRHAKGHRPHRPRRAHFQSQHPRRQHDGQHVDRRPGIQERHRRAQPRPALIDPAKERQHRAGTNRQNGPRD